MFVQPEVQEIQEKDESQRLPLVIDNSWKQVFDKSIASAHSYVVEFVGAFAFAFWAA